MCYFVENMKLNEIESSNYRVIHFIKSQSSLTLIKKWAREIAKMVKATATQPNNLS